MASQRPTTGRLGTLVTPISGTGVTPISGIGRAWCALRLPRVGLRHFAAQHSDIPRRLDPNLHLSAFHSHDGDRDILAHVDSLLSFARDDEHGRLLFLLSEG
jgi:hypothetical protein